MDTFTSDEIKFFVEAACGEFVDGCTISEGEDGKVIVTEPSGKIHEVWPVEEELNIQVQANALMDAIGAVVKKWGTSNGTCLQIHTNSGSVEFQNIRYGEAARIAGVSHPWPSDWIEVERYDKSYSAKGDLNRGTELLERLVQFLASRDFTDKVEGSVSTLKKITKALS